MNKEQRVQLAQETIQLTKPLKNYKVAVHSELATLQTLLTRPLDKVNTEIHVVSATTLQAILANQSDEKFGVLNFASGMNVGGGFLKGTTTQEESLCYASNLYQSLLEAKEYYNANNYNKNIYYNPNFIVSENITFIRDSKHNLLANPISGITVITSPAVNCKYLKQINQLDSRKVKQVMEQRIESIIRSFVIEECTTLVLGAFGCGVFKNDPELVATIFKNMLNKYSGYFSKVIFAIPKGTKDSNYEVFKRVLL